MQHTSAHPIINPSVWKITTTVTQKLGDVEPREPEDKHGLQLLPFGDSRTRMHVCPSNLVGKGWHLVDPRENYILLT
jgi:hypothetical protein